MGFRVAMLSLHTSPLARLGRTRDAGGMNVYVRELSRELGRSGTSVDVFTRWTDPSDLPCEHLSDRVRLLRVQAGPVASLPNDELLPHVDEFVHHIRRFAERSGHSYDLIHSHYWLSGVAGVELARTWEVPQVTMFHTLERLKGERQGTPADLTLAGARRADHEGLIAATADCIIVATTHERDQIQRLYGLPASRIKVIPCGVDLRTFTPDDTNAPGGAAARRAARSALGLGAEAILLAVGRLDPIKGADLLLESTALMRTPATLILVGGDPDGDPELERLRMRAAQLGLADRVRLPGAVPQSDLPQYYRAADALVVASRYESFGLVALEALACGTPVVAAKVGGLPSIVHDDENGILVPWRCPEAFAEQLDALLADAPRLRRLRVAARSSAERFAWQRIGDQVRGLYGALTAECRCSAACSCI